MNVHLVDAPGDFEQINLHVLKVEIHDDATGWVTLGTPDETVDLLTLTGGVEETLVNGASIPAGHYSQLRLLLGPGNTVKLQDGTVHDLKVPSGLQSGVKLTVSFDVQPNTTKDVFIDFDAHRSVFVHGAGSSGQYILRPVVRAVDRLVTGAVVGTLTTAQGEPPVAIPLAGALVTAQVIDAGGTASIVRATRTAADGTYVLDLLPVGGTYFVVSQPIVGTAVYLARSSGPIAVTATAPTPSYDASFDATLDFGSATGTVTPTATADDADTVDARVVLDAGGTSHAFIVRTAAAAVSGGAETYRLDDLPAATYSLSDTRRSVDTAGVETVKTSAAVSAAVTAGGTATANLVLP
jgi:hypothetical protein